MHPNLSVIKAGHCGVTTCSPMRRTSAFSAEPPQRAMFPPRPRLGIPGYPGDGHRRAVAGNPRRSDQSSQRWPALVADHFCLLAPLCLVTRVGAAAAGFGVHVDFGRTPPLPVLAAGAAATDAVAFASIGNICYCRVETMSSHPALIARRAKSVKISARVVGCHGVGMPDSRVNPRFFLTGAAASPRRRAGGARAARLGPSGRPAQAAWAAKFLKSQSGG